VALNDVARPGLHLHGREVGSGDAVARPRGGTSEDVVVVQEPDALVEAAESNGARDVRSDEVAPDEVAGRVGPREAAAEVDSAVDDVARVGRGPTDHAVGSAEHVETLRPTVDQVEPPRDVGSDQ